MVGQKMLCKFLWQVIRLKCIYNFFLFHAYISDFVVGFATLSYLLQHIWTNLLTQCPSASFCLLLSVHCRKISNIKNQQSGRIQKARGKRESPPIQAASWRGQGWGRTTWPPGQVGPPRALLLPIYC